MNRLLTCLITLTMTQQCDIIVPKDMQTPIFIVDSTTNTINDTITLKYENSH